MATLALRQNLQIQKAPAERDGEPGWLLHDPVTSRYFKLGKQEIGLLRHFSGLEINKELDTESVEFKSFFAFLSENDLLSCNNDVQRKYLQASLLKRKKSKGIKSLFSRYLSLRIPLFRSDRFLTSLLSFVRPVLGWHLWVMLLGCAFAGIYMTVNQWGRFSNTFFEMVSPGGFACFVAALIVVKIMHEIGHGLVAKYYGCYVPTIGVTFLVFWPVLYTDTSSAWLLPSHRKRFMIALAGMGAEIIVAILALFLWHFLPAGALKSICFMLATTTWILSLAVNLNPLMRFDGYFLLADWWKTDNLMQRSLALAKWSFRRIFWGVEASPPEQPQLRMIVYGWCCWIYRFFLIIGISLVVYHLIYKPLGVVLMVSMIVRSIVKPMFSEVKFLIENIKKVANKGRFALSVSGLLVLCLLLVLPVQQRLTLPAVISGAASQKIYMPFDGQLSSIKGTARVAAGEQLYQLHVPDLLYQLEVVTGEQERLMWQLNQYSIADQYLDPRPRIKNELLAVTKKLTQLQNVMTQHSYSAPFSGRFEVSDPWLKRGDWVKKGTLLGALVDDQQTRVDAYLAELDRDLLQPVADKKTVGLFYPDNGLSEPTELLLESVGTIAIQQLNHPELASINGGTIGVNQTQNKTLVPVASYYLLRFNSEQAAPGKQIPGVVIINGEAHSFLGRIWLRIVAVFRKETDI
ncbi:MAG: M50 family metallopeptidase [Psychromonas sp.]